MDQLNVQRAWPPVLEMKTNVGTDKIEFILYEYKFKDRRVTYMISVCDIRPQKKRLTEQVSLQEELLLDYPGEVSTQTSELTTMKLHVNSAVSDIKSRYMCMDVKYFYLNNHTDRVEYIMIQISMISQ